MISIVTPSFRQPEWLRLAIASVADQEDVELEHIVQDGGSDFDPAVFAAPHLRMFVERDEGMYDAINRGLQRATGSVCAYLNCDEQYLPGALEQVARAFAEDQQLDVLLAGSVVVDEHGRYLCSRPALPASLRQLRGGQMYNLTASIFFRSRVISERQILFNPALRVIGDLDWLRRVVEAGCVVRAVEFNTSVFSDLGTNLALSDEAASEAKADSAGKPWARVSSKMLVAAHRFNRLLAGHYSLPPFDYAIYTRSNPAQRTAFHVARPTGVWRNRL